jgi:hypothetical protein
MDLTILQSKIREKYDYFRCGGIYGLQPTRINDNVQFDICLFIFYKQQPLIIEKKTYGVCVIFQRGLESR